MKCSRLQTKGEFEEECFKLCFKGRDAVRRSYVKGKFFPDVLGCAGEGALSRGGP